MNTIDNFSNSSIDNILKFLPYFKDNDKPFYKIDKDDLFHPYVYSREVNKFLATIIKEEFTIVFDWTEWQKEAVKYFKDPELIDAVEITTLRKLMTMFIRKERFCSGFINSVIDTGMILKILERLNTLKAE